MRSDMAKVIVERARHGSSARARKKGYRKYVQQTGVEQLPLRETMLGRWRGRGRWLNEHLGPLKRFLRSQVGRPWNKVHEALCEHVSFDNAVQSHIFSHIEQFVELSVELVAGRPCYGVSLRLWRRQGEPLPAGQMYVCPRSGILRVARAPQSRRPLNRVGSGCHRQFQQRGGQWWELRLQALPDVPDEQWDVWFERSIDKIARPELIAAFGGKLFAVSKRLLSPRQTRALHRSVRRSPGRRPVHCP